MFINKILRQGYKNINQSYKSFNKLRLLTKLFIIFLFLVIIYIILNNFDQNIKYYNIESFDNILLLNLKSIYLFSEYPNPFDLA